MNPSNVSNISYSLMDYNTVEYIAMTWHDLKVVCMIAGVICLAAGYAINELWHRHNDKQEA